MSKKIQVIGFLILLFCSVVYDFQKPKEIEKPAKTTSYVILEGEFLKQGKHEFEGKQTVQDIINEVGVSDQANLKALSLAFVIQDETTLYLPPKNQKCISLNHAKKAELMTLERIGEKTAQKIIDYRQTQQFSCLEDIMNVSGIGEKTYLRIRDYLCL